MVNIESIMYWMVEEYNIVAYSLWYYNDRDYRTRVPYSCCIYVVCYVHLLNGLYAIVEFAEMCNTLSIHKQSLRKLFLCRCIQKRGVARSTGEGNVLLKLCGCGLSKCGLMIVLQCNSYSLQGCALGLQGKLYIVLFQY